MLRLIKAIRQLVYKVATYGLVNGCF